MNNWIIIPIGLQKFALVYGRKIGGKFVAKYVARIGNYWAIKQFAYTLQIHVIELF